MKSLAFIATAFLAAVNAASVTFKVIAPNATDSVQVNINGALTSLNASDPDVPYYTGTAEYDLGANYKYVVDGQAESFDRVLNSGEATRNDFFSRNVTYANIPAIPTALADGAFPRNDDHPIWDTNYITSIFVTGNKDDMNNLIENVPDNAYPAKITFIGPDDVYTFENCTFGLHRPGRKNNDAKQSWKWALPKDKFLANRNWFKIRHQEEDPTQLREKLYADIARSIGTYANQANMVRFFINKEGMGTFNMLDDVIMYSYINAVFFDGNAPKQMGGLYDGGSGADFNPATGYDSFIPNVESPLKQDAIGPFAEAFSKVDFSNDAQVQGISQYFDYDQFLRFMIMEYLTGDWDGYWQEQTNDGAFINTANDPAKLYYLGQDFDATFGVNLPFENDFVNVKWTEYKSKFPNAFLVNKLLSNKKLNETFAANLETVWKQVFNYNTLKPIVEARHDFYYPDLVWDRSIKQRSPGNVFGWTAEQTKENLYNGVSAPGGSGGGAAFGLLEWVQDMDNTLKSTFGGSSNTSQKFATINAAAVEAAEASAAGKNVPQILSALAVVAAIAALA